MNEKPTPDLRKVLAGTAKFIGLGSGAMLAYFLLQLFTPEAIAGVLKSWGPGAGTAMVLGGLLIWRLDVRAGQGVNAVHEMSKSVETMSAAQRGLEGAMTSVAQNLTSGVQNQAVSLRDMSESMNRLANKDNELLLRLEARIDETSDRTKRILAWIEKEEERLNRGANR